MEVGGKISIIGETLHGIFLSTWYWLSGFLLRILRPWYGTVQVPSGNAAAGQGSRMSESPRWVGMCVLVVAQHLEFYLFKNELQIKTHVS